MAHDLTKVNFRIKLGENGLSVGGVCKGLFS